MKIKKAVIPVAGYGTRFLPFTKSTPKELIPIVDTPVLQILVEEIIDCGITEILLITNRGKNQIADHFDYNYELFDVLEKSGKNEEVNRLKKITDSCSITTIRQVETKGLGHAILKAENFVNGEDFAMLLGDELVFNKKQSALKQTIKAYERFDVSVIAARRVAGKDVNKYGIIEGVEIDDHNYEIKSLYEKPNEEEAKSDIAIMGRNILKPEIFDCLKQVKPGVNGEIQMTDAYRKYVQNNRMIAHLFEGKRYDTGNKEGFIKATVEYALRDKEINQSVFEYLKEVVLNKNEEYFQGR